MTLANETTDQLLVREGKRKLATIQIVQSCEKHPNADTLHIVKFSTCLWQSVTKQEYKPGDYVVMFEPDAKFDSQEVLGLIGLPADFKYVKSSKLRGVLSQVYVCPADCVAELIGYDPSKLLGQDLSQQLSISKYVKQNANSDCKLAGDIAKMNLFNMGLVPKTDELRLQSSPWLLDEVCHGQWYVTQKLDGTSTTYAWHEDRLHVGGRNFFLTDLNNKYMQLATTLQLATSMAELGRNLAVQGELCGPKIQGNKLKLSEYQFFAFKVWDIDNQRPLPLSEALAVCKQLHLDFVPILLNATGLKVTDKEYLFGLANSQTWHDQPAEGIVVSTADCKSSFKIINENFR